MLYPKHAKILYTLHCTFFAPYSLNKCKCFKNEGGGGGKHCSGWVGFRDGCDCGVFINIYIQHKYQMSILLLIYAILTFYYMTTILVFRHSWVM